MFRGGAGVIERAEDVTQEAWLRAVRSWREKGLPRKPLAWLHTVARNVLLNRLRQRQPIALDDVAPGELMRVATSNDQPDSGAAAAALHRALEQLPRDRSRLLELYHLGQADRAHLLRAELELAEKVAEVGRHEAQLRADPTRPPQR
jgi:RNA polymerase sigma factor (sigma-70 family)